jgi:hypothetical protein
VAIGAVELQSVTSGCCTVTQEVVGSSPVALAKSCRVRLGLARPVDLLLAGGIGDELTASEETLRFGWASWAIHGLFKKLTDCGDAS